MSFGPLNNANDTPIGAADYRGFILQAEPNDGDILVWDATNKHWAPGSLPTVQINSLSVGGSTADQNPAGSGIGNQIQIDFGGFNDWTVPADGQYSLTLRLAAERTGIGGEAWLWVYATINGTPSGDPLLLKLDNNRQREMVDTTILTNLTQGDVYAFWLYRDSGQMDEGGLVAAVNPDALGTAYSAYFQATRTVLG